MTIVNGTNSSETLVGTTGDDVITGFGGDDTLTGLTGSDRFVYTARFFGQDTITDFTQGQDKIDLSAFNIGNFSEIQPLLTQVGADSKLSLFFGSVTESITIRGLLPSQLTAADFIFDTTTTARTLTGTSSADLILGSLGNDTIVGGSGNDTLVGGAGNDTLNGGSGDDTLTGSSGSDFFVYDARFFGQDTIADFTQGQDKIDLSALNIGDFSEIQPLLTQVGADSKLSLFFGSVTESITIRGLLPSQLTAADFIFDTTTTARTLTGTSSADLILGSLGNDTIVGGSGNDTLVGGAGNDTLNGGSGDDTLTGSSGSDFFVYDARFFGQDTIADFTQGQDKIDLSALNIGDFSEIQPLLTQVGADSKLSLFFGSVAESITIRGLLPSQLTAADFIFDTTTMARTLTGTSSADLILGSLGNDTIVGGSGNDTLVGGAGNDTLNGGSGDDTLTGSSGSEFFVYDARFFGQDTITDFTQGQDKIDLSALNIGDFSEIQPLITQAGADSKLTLFFNNNLESITMRGLLPSQLTAADFIFDTTTTAKSLGGSAGSDVILGSLGNDTIIGGSGSDTLVGGAGNDTLNGGTGDDTLIGGAGSDTAIYAATAAQITFSRNANGTLTISSNADGTDTLTDVEFAQFNGIRYHLGRYADPGGVRVADFAVNAGGWSSQDKFPRHVADVNGDGFADIVGFGQAGTLVAFGSANGTFSGTSTAVANFGQNQGWTSDNTFHRELVDVNHDGKADIVGFGIAGVLVSLAQTGGTFAAPVLGSTNFNPANGWSSQDSFTRTLADVNGDGFADVVGFGVAGTFVALGNGSGSFAAANFVLADFGKNQGWTSDNTFHRTVADVNGDGKADIIGFGIAGALVALGKADGTFAAPTLALANFGTNQGWSSQDAFTRAVGDINGDGKADIVGFGIAGTFVSYGQADGTLSAASFDLPNFGKNQGWTSDNIFHRELADLNGDHFADIIGFGANGVFTTGADTSAFVI